MASKLGCIWCYHGSKIRYLESALSVIPNQEHPYKILDLFTGGSSVATSLPNSWEVTANDMEVRVIDLSRELKSLLGIYSPTQIEEIVRNHCRSNVDSNKDEEGYLKLKERYNSGDRTPLNLFALTMASNSNMIRFNSSGEQTLQYGKRYYNNNSSNKMLAYLNRLLERKVTFSSEDFRKFSEKDDYDVWLIDPPYKVSKATYSECGQWTIKDEVDLLSQCDRLNAVGKKFIYFNQTFCQDKENIVVNKWKDKYKNIILADTTSNCSAQRKNKGKTVELMIHNF